MNRDSIRQFVRRDWTAVATPKARFWHALKAGRSAADVLALADQMRRMPSASVRTGPRASI